MRGRAYLDGLRKTSPFPSLGPALIEWLRRRIVQPSDQTPQAFPAGSVGGGVRAKLGLTLGRCTGSYAANFWF
jgi:hypothetical protein